jgi:SAM-dependent methyltransferase
VPDSSAFDAFYFKHCCGKPYVRDDEWLGVFERIAERIAVDMAPRRVLDAGCAFGFLVERLRQRGIEAEGIDLSPYAIEQVAPETRPFCRVGSIADALDRDYDLIVSIEVVEHMDARGAESAVANFCRHTNDVLFSSSPLDYREPTHVNVHPPEHWAELFARHGFFRDVDYDATFVLPSAARFRKRQEPAHRVVRDYERQHWHLLQAANDARGHGVEIQKRLAAEEAARARLEQEVARLTTSAADLSDRLDREHQRGNDLAHRLNQALDTIGHMERSVFWKLRAAMTRMLGR